MGNAEKNKVPLEIKNTHREFLNILRGASILRVVLVHLGLSWFYLPYSSYVGILLPILFFVAGAVSLASFTRAKSTWRFLRKRLATIIGPYYILAFFILVISSFIEEWQTGSIWRWMLMSPDTSTLPFSLGQVWFLQSLSIITVFSLPFFLWFKTTSHGLIPLLTVCSAIVTLNSITPIHHNLVFFGFLDMYLAISNCLFFILGGLYFVHIRHINNAFFLLCSLALISLGVVSKIYSIDLAISKNMASPDLTYCLFAIGALGVILSCQETILAFISRFTRLKALLTYSSTHAYSIYLLHTLVLALVEQTLFPYPLTGQHGLALLRMLCVLILTLLIAPSFTKFTAIVVDKVK